MLRRFALQGELIQLILRIDGNAVFKQQRDSHAVAGDFIAGKGAVVNQSLTAGGAFAFRIAKST